MKRIKSPQSHKAWPINPLISLLTLAIISLCTIEGIYAEEATREWLYIGEAFNAEGYNAKGYNAEGYNAEVPLAEGDLAALYNNVKPFRLPYATSDVYALDNHAMAILVGEDSVGVVAQYGRGRIAVLGSEDFLSMRELKRNPDMQRFVANVKTWLRQGSDQKVVVPNPYMSAQEAEALLRYIDGGGCALVAYKGWVMDYTPDLSRNAKVSKAKGLAEYPLQMALNTMGIAYSTMSEIEQVNCLAPDYEAFKEMDFLNLWVKLDMLYDVDQDLSSPALQTTELGRYYSDFTRATDILKSIHPDSRPGKVLARIYQTTDWLATTNYSLQFFAIRQQAIHRPLGLMEGQGAHAHVAQFPGLLTGEAAAVSKVIRVSLEGPQANYLRTNTIPENWISTGLYAAPGQNIRLLLPKGVYNLEVQIGAHQDRLEFRPNLRRMPVVTGRQRLKTGTNTVSSPFGGLIYLVPLKPTQDMPRNQVMTADVRVEGAIEAPFFQLGITSPEAWAQQLANTATPWCELSGKRMILTVPTDYVTGDPNTGRNALTDPTELMKTWDLIVTLQEELAGITDAERPKAPWRIVTDAQLSVGFMYSGYPIMAHTEASAASLLNVASVKQREWGAWHELGHNYQMPAMTWSDMGEVTNNLFSLFVQAHFENLSYLHGGESAVFGDGTTDGIITPYIRAMAYLALPQDERHYGEIDAFDRLVLFDQLRERYGWELITALHKHYRQLPLSDTPITDAEKLEHFMQICSQLAKEDLTPFFTNWGLVNP